MEYARFDKHIIARLDKGEEILEQVRVIALKENIRLASVNALGAVNDFTVGVYFPDEKQYHANTFTGNYEISSLMGTVNTMNGEFYTHLHMTAAGPDGSVVGGHLSRGVVSLTCEMVIEIIDGSVDRYYSEELGINLLKF